MRRQKPKTNHRLIMPGTSPDCSWVAVSILLESVKYSVKRLGGLERRELG